MVHRHENYVLKSSALIVKTYSSRQERENQTFDRARYRLLWKQTLNTYPQRFSIDYILHNFSKKFVWIVLNLSTYC
jgi:hypothetical protein